MPEERVVGFVGFGELAANVARSLVGRGVECLLLGEGRSPATLARAADIGVESVDAAALCARADVIMSLVPPAEALAAIEALAPAIERSARAPVYIDANSISPASASVIAERVIASGAGFVDGTFHVFPRDGAPRLYACGPAVDAIGWLAGPGLEIYPLGADLAAAGRLKMCLSLIRKTSIALWLTALAEAERAGISEAIARELAHSEEPMAQSHVFAAFTTLSDKRKLTARARRWIGEMSEVARTFPDGPARQLGDAARGVFELMAELADTEGDRSDVDSLRRALDPDGPAESS